MGLEISMTNLKIQIEDPGSVSIFLLLYTFVCLYKGIFLFSFFISYRPGSVITAVVVVTGNIWQNNYQHLDMKLLAKGRRIFFLQADLPASQEGVEFRYIGVSLEYLSGVYWYRRKMEFL